MFHTAKLPRLFRIIFEYVHIEMYREEREREKKRKILPLIFKGKLKLECESNGELMKLIKKFFTATLLFFLFVFLQQKEN